MTKGSASMCDNPEHLNSDRRKAMKYILRAGYKSSETELDDLYKARWHIVREIYRLEHERRSGRSERK